MSKEVYLVEDYLIQWMANCSVRERVGDVIEPWMLSTNEARDSLAIISSEDYYMRNVDHSTFTSEMINYGKERYTDAAKLTDKIKKYCKLVKNSSSTYSEGEMDKILRVIRRYVMDRKASKALTEYLSTSGFNEGKLELLSQSVAEANAVTFEASERLDLTDPKILDKLKADSMVDEESVVKSCFSLVNDEISHGGYLKGDLVTVVAESGHGKTTSMINEAVASLKAGRSVLHIHIGDNTEYDIITTYTACLTGKMKQAIAAEGVSEYLPVVSKYFKNLRYESLEPGRLSVDNIVARMNQIYRKQAFDVAVVDYDANIKLPEGVKVHEAYGVMYLKLKSFANKRCVLFVGSQSNRSGWGNEKSDKGTISDSAQKVWHSTYVLGIGRNSSCNLVGNVTLLKSRSGGTGKYRHVHFDDYTATYECITSSEYESYVSQYEERSTNSGDISVDYGGS